MLDVVLGYHLKGYFSDRFEKLIKRLQEDIPLPTYSSEIRFVEIKSIVSACFTVQYYI